MYYTKREVFLFLTRIYFLCEKMDFGLVPRLAFFVHTFYTIAYFLRLYQTFVFFFQFHNVLFITLLEMIRSVFPKVD